MQLAQELRQFYARMSAGLATLFNRSGVPQDRLQIKLDARALRFAGIFLLTALSLYYPLGATINHRIDADPNFDVPASKRLTGDSHAVGLAVGLIDREVNQHAWVGNSPFYLPTSLLHNMASYQSAILEAITHFCDALGDSLERRGMRSDDLIATVDRLSKRPDLWSWNWSEPWGYLGNSESEYREGLLDLQGFNVALADGVASFPRDAQTLSAILSGFSEELHAVAQALATEADYRPIILSRRVGDAFYRARGVAYGQSVLMRGLTTDFAALIHARGLETDIAQVEISLKRVAEFSPAFIINGRPDGVLLPSHPMSQSYFVLDAQRALNGVITKLK